MPGDANSHVGSRHGHVSAEYGVERSPGGDGVVALAIGAEDLSLIHI